MQRPPDASVSLMQGDVPADTFRIVGPGRLVGRQGALAQLHRRLQQALRGGRQTVFVTGEAGLGKMTLIETFLGEVSSELALMGLSQAEVEAYLMERHRNDALATALGPMLHRGTEGNPLFMVNLLEHWIAHDWLSQEHGRWMLRSGWEAIAREIPPTLRELVMQRQSRLSPTEQRLVEVASVAGLEFSAASIAAGLAAEVVETECPIRTVGGC